MGCQSTLPADPTPGEPSEHPKVARPGLRVAFLPHPTGVELYVGDGPDSMMMVGSVDNVPSDPDSLMGVWRGFVERGHFELVPEAHLESLVAYSDAVGEEDQGWVLDPAQTEGERLLLDSLYNFVLVRLQDQGAEEESAFETFAKEVEAEADADPTGQARAELDALRKFYASERERFLARRTRDGEALMARHAAEDPDFETELRGAIEDIDAAKGVLSLDPKPDTA